MTSEQEFFAALYKDAPTPVQVINEAGRPIYRTAAMQDLQDRLGELRVSSQWTFAVREKVAECLASGRFALETVPIDGGTLRLSLLPYPYQDRRYLVVQAEEQPALAPDQLQRLLHISHEKLSSYLNEIYGVAQTVGTDTADGQNLSVAVRRIMRMTNHLSRALTDQPSAPYRLPINVGNFTAGFLQNLKEIAPQLQIRMAPYDPNLHVRMTPEDMELVLITLLTNAERFGNDAITVQVAARDEQICITVLDNGPGLAEPDRLFEWGYRTRDKNGRLGLGFSLPLAKKILAQQDADLEYTHDAAGTAFRIVMQKIEPEMTLAEWQPESPDNNLSQIRVELSDLMKKEK